MAASTWGPSRELPWPQRLSRVPMPMGHDWAAGVGVGTGVGVGAALGSDVGVGCGPGVVGLEPPPHPATRNETATVTRRRDPIDKPIEPPSPASVAEAVRVAPAP